MWELYDRLIEEVKDGVVAEEVVVGQIWTLTKSNTVGLAMSSPQLTTSNFVPGTCQGQTVKELARLIKSWDFLEAAIGLSAINSILNSRETMNSIVNNGFKQLPSGSAFEMLGNRIEGEKVAMIGHFPNVDELSKLCNLTVIERKPSNEDLPDPAVEYLLPEQDIVFITSSTLINKTAPRLLELSKNSLTIMLGPSTPLSPVLFEMGVDIISGLIVEESEQVLRCIKEGGGTRRFRNAVTYVNLAKENYL
ncbi:Rossmann-like domain-containing protein [Cytobacillus praedii]|uniref:Rossmann-like domain-containing protein n=1 Tax=Cytobacillus praedii TaxID=1742358 RepID=UPI003F80BD06